MNNRFVSTLYSLFKKHYSESTYLSALRKVPIFSDLSTHELNTIDDLLHIRRYIKNEVIFDEQEEGQAIYFVLSGNVLISKQEKSIPIASLDSGQFFGERALLESAPRVAQATAQKDCVLAVLFRDDFLNLLRTHPKIAQKISLHCSLRINTQLLSINAPENTDIADINKSSGPLAWLGIITSTCLVIFLFKKLLWLVIPFLLALILYYLLAPVARKLVLLGISRAVAAVTLSSTFLIGFGLMIMLFYPYAISHLETWQTDFYTYLAGGFSLIQTVLLSLQGQFSFLRNAGLEQDFYQLFSEFNLQFTQQKVSHVIGNFAAWLPSLLLTPIITFFLLKDGAELRKMLGSAVPNAFFEKTLYLIHALDKTARTYFIGTLKITLIDTCIIALGLAILGIPKPLLLGLMAAVLSWIPYLGPLLACLITMIVAATDAPNQLGVIYSILGLFAFVRVLDDFVFLPLVLGKSLHLHPLLTLLMFLIGEAIAGVTGLMLVIPILAMMMVLGETLALIFKDTRLQARHVYAKKIRWIAASKGLDD